MQFEGGMVVAIDKDLVLTPHFVEGSHQFMGVFGHILQLGLDVVFDKALDILPDESIDRNFVLGEWLLLCQLVNESG